MTYEKAVTSTQYYNEIAKKFDWYLGAGDKYKPEDMAEKIDNVYKSGYNLGTGEGEARGYELGIVDGNAQGRQEQHAEFWNVIQNNGQKVSYSEMFKNPRWTDDIFDPQHTMVGSSFYRCFMGNTSITRIPVTIDCRNPTSTNGLTQTFRNMTNLVTIHNILCDDSDTTVWDATFENDAKLAEVTFDEKSVIGSNIDFSDCPKLTEASVDSILSHLKDFVAAGSTETRTLTLHSTTLSTLSDETITEYKEKGWTIGA